MTTAYTGPLSWVVLSDAWPDGEDAFRLVEWPSKQVVSSTVYSSPINYANRPATQFHLVPQRPLSERWYALLMSDGVQADVIGAKQVETHLVARFKRGSQPIVRGVTVAEEQDTTFVQLRLSEVIHDERSSEDIVRVLDDRTGVMDCTAVSSVGVHQPGVIAFAIRCAGSAHPSSLRLEIPPNIYGRSGAALRFGFGNDAHSLALQHYDGRARLAIHPTVFEP